MYNEETGNALMIHAFKEISDMKNMYSAYKQEADKIMFIAHPDDELIFGGVALLTENNWRVVCLSNRSNQERKMEFEKSMRDLSVPEFEIYDLEDNINNNFNETKLISIIEKELGYKKWKKIVTHNSIGEYGHPHHKQVHDKVRDILDNDELLWVFDKEKKTDLVDIINKKTEIFFKRYKSQKGIFEQIKHHRGRWFQDKYMDTNYIDNGIIVKYEDSKYKNDNFIHCFNK